MHGFYTHTHTHTHTHTRTHTHTHARTHTYTHRHITTDTHAHTETHTETHTHRLRPTSLTPPPPPPPPPPSTPICTRTLAHTHIAAVGSVSTGWRFSLTLSLDFAVKDRNNQFWTGKNGDGWVGEGGRCGELSLGMTAGIMELTEQC